MDNLAIGPMNQERKARGLQARPTGEDSMGEKNYLKQYLDRTRVSKKLFERTQKVMPGGVSHRIRYFPPYPIFIKKADGSRIWDVDGHEYVDLWMGHYALILGHKPLIVKSALEEVAEIGLHWGIVHEYQIQFAELIQQTVPCAEKIIFGVSGTEATMHAVRLARGFTRKQIILKIAGGWHGANNELLRSIRSPFDKPESAGLIPEIGKYTRPIQFNDMESTLRTIGEVKDDLAGIIVEPVVGSGGLIPADKGYLEMLRQETRKGKALLIFDEIITGYRLSLGGAQEVYGITPDLATLGKVCGGGTNLGVIAGRADILSLCDPTGKHEKGESVVVGGGTFSCSPFSMIVGRRVVEYLKNHARDLYPRIDQSGEKLREGMARAFRRNGIAGKSIGVGSLCGAYFPYKPETIVRNPADMQQLTDLEKLDHEFKVRMLNHGVFVMHGGGGVSAAHTDDDIGRVIAAVDKVAQEMSVSAA
jgi:glutamate-1-semialdehyde 2,1-aminomutase